MSKDTKIGMILQSNAEAKITHDEARHYAKTYPLITVRNLLVEYVRQQEQQELDLLMQVTEYGMSELELKKVVKRYLDLLYKKDLIIDKGKALEIIRLTKQIKEMVEE